MKSKSPLPFGIHRVPAPVREDLCDPNPAQCHHCLSAFTAFLPRRRRKTPIKAGQKSPLPFGIHRVPAADIYRDEITAIVSSPLPFGIHRVPARAVSCPRSPRAVLSPLPFGIHRVPAASDELTMRNGRRKVTIAFRHSPRSCLNMKTTIDLIGQSVTIAFRHSPRSCPMCHGLLWPWQHHVTIAFRHSPRSCRRTSQMARNRGQVTIAFRHSPRSCHDSGIVR